MPLYIYVYFFLTNNPVIWKVSYSEGTKRYLVGQKSENIKTPKSILSTKVKVGITKQPTIDHPSRQHDQCNKDRAIMYYIPSVKATWPVHAIRTELSCISQPTIPSVKATWPMHAIRTELSCISRPTIPSIKATWPVHAIVTATMDYLKFTIYTIICHGSMTTSMNYT